MKQNQNIRPLTDEAARKLTAEKLYSYGVTFGTRSFRQLVDCVMLWRELDNPTGLCPMMTKEIYPAVAKCNHTTARAVERNCRYAVNQIAETDLTRARCLSDFRMEVRPRRGWFSVSEFVALFCSCVLYAGEWSPQ